LESLKQWWSETVSSVPGDATPSLTLETARRLESLSEAAAEDAGQPSWQVLAHLLGETLFAQIERLVGFERFWRSVDVGGLVELLGPLWRDHALAGLVESYGVDPRLDREHLDSLISGLEVTQPRPELKYLRTQLEIAGDRSPTATIWSELGIERSALDETADDLRLLLEHSHDAGAARRLQRVSPDSPAALAALITKDWPVVAERAERWRNQPVHPQIARELAARYRRLQQPEDAVEVLERYVAEIPDSWAYTELASIHAELGNADEWVRALEDSLASSDEDGMAQARARERLAWYYNERGKFSKARPYADRAAVTGAIWALRVAAWTYEGLGDWKRAEELRRKISERYESARIHWYFWCRRTGRGNLGAARRLAESALPDRRAAGGGQPIEVGVFLLLEGKLEAAEREFRTVFESTGNPLAGLNLAFTLFDLGRPEAEEVLAQVSERGPAFVEREHVLGELLQLTAASRRLLAGELTPEAHRVIVDGALASLDDRWRVNTDYYLGRFLEIAGAEAEARRALDRSAEAYHLGMWNSTVAADRLRQLD
jgi:tetratricopeptide (TPR) repeat protein